ncbi:MAG TPA: hypoxanthine phosphoribosyltransferase [Proteobacteria bacterium]|nr:hypoxanthine phosphoribosyltransferase [bacterium BMS3Abin14]HDL53180.1 hypoxanthine phosphoribosyltransferase [Pseudomonadota bacterium]
MRNLTNENLRPVLTAEQIGDRVREMALQIGGELDGSFPLFVGILKGAFIFLADLVRALDITLEVDFAEISSYGDETTSSGRIKVIKDITTPVAGRHVIVVEDIIDTGRTLAHYLDELQTRGPASLRVCALVDKPERQEFTLDIDYVGFQIEKGFLVGYGLDWGGKYRELPGIFEVKQ